MQGAGGRVMAGLARFEKVVGTVTRAEASRTFVDGVYYAVLEVDERGGGRRQLERVFVTNRLLPAVTIGATATFYFWNAHCYAVRGELGVIEDVQGARASYFQRDARLLMIMAASIVLLPVVALVAMKKLARSASAEQMQRFASIQ